MFWVLIAAEGGKNLRGKKKRKEERQRSFTLYPWCYSELGSDAIQKVLMLSVAVDLIGECYSMLSVSRGFDWSMLFDAIREPWI